MVTTLILSAGLHGRHGVAGIDRPHEGVGRDDLDGLGDLADIEQRRDARRHVLADRIGRHDDVAVVRRELHDQRRDVLGQPVGVGRILGLQHLGDALQIAAADLAASPQSLPATSTVHVGVHLARGGDGVGDVGADGLVVMRGDDENGHGQITPASFFSLSTSSATVFTLMPPLRLGGSSTFSTLSRGATSTPSASGASDLDRLLLGLHDVGQRGVARLVEAQVGGDHRRHLELDVLEAAVDLALHLDRAVGDVELVGEGALRPAEQRGQHLAGGVGIVVDRLLADDHQAGLLLVDHGLEQLGDGQRLQLGVGLHQDAAVGAHGERGADRLLALRGSGGKGDDLGRGALLSHADRLFHGDLVEGVHGHLDVRRLDARVVGLDANLDVVVDDPLDRDQHFHRVAPAR